MKRVSVLCVRSDSIYKTISGVDAWDATRNASLFLGSSPVVCHPPCRSWGRLRAFATPRDGERDLARSCVWHVRTNGGVLEHPETSTLWQDMGLPRPGEQKDKWGGWTLGVDQFWWGHKARKRTWLYIVGIDPRRIPQMPFAMGDASHTVESKSKDRPSIKKADRERTPPDFAAWLVELARRCAT